MHQATKSSSIKLTDKEKSIINIIRNIYSQQVKLFNKEEVKNRIVSISKPYLRPIVRGKENKAVEFGAKVNTIQTGGFNFIDKHSFGAFHEGIRVPECILLHKVLFNIRPHYFAADAIYATNANRTYCRINNIITNFVPKGRAPKVDETKKVRKLLNIERSTRLEGSFGTEKEHYSLRKVKARTKNNETLWVLMSIHIANYSRLAARIYLANKKVEAAAKAS